MSISDRECPDCGEPVDEDGDTTQGEDDTGCPYPGWWAHPDDCDTCGHIDCDRSC